ncbi:MAG: hypothetical protein BGN88_09140 [Clostridiales bacterium 43-6]|mgnify:CR=1 FL=1|nr:MAG: hypothetical protein BGN88_09140 [Clostridiales bacterium 43-6]
MASERLDKIIANYTSITRTQARKLIVGGKVTVDGVVMKKPEAKTDPECAVIKTEDTTINAKRHLYIMMNKPAGVISASRDNNATTVIDLLPEHLQRKNLFPAGRLDKDTEGLLIITDDGEFAHRLLSPKSKVNKVYIARVDNTLTENEIKLFADGVQLKDGTKCLPAKMTLLSDTVAEVQIYEGKYHQIKRMFAAVGFQVLSLQRIRIGQLSLPDNLSKSQVRELKIEEIELLCENDR